MSTDQAAQNAATLATINKLYDDAAAALLAQQAKRRKS